MATATSLIDDAFILIGIKAPGEAATANEAQGALRKLNYIIDEWDIEGLMDFTQTLTTGNITANNGTYTLGPTGSFVVPARPNAILDAYVTFSGLDYILTPIDDRSYDAIVNKQLADSIPQNYKYEPSFPNGQIKLFPIQNQAGTITLRYYTNLSSFTTLSTNNLYPKGYDKALIYALAIELGIEYGYSKPDVVERFKQLKAGLSRNNLRIATLKMDPRMPRGDSYPISGSSILNNWGVQ